MQYWSQRPSANSEHDRKAVDVLYDRSRSPPLNNPKASQKKVPQRTKITIKKLVKQKSELPSGPVRREEGETSSPKG